MSSRDTPTPTRNKKIGKNRAPIRDDLCTRRSTLSVRLCLRNFCVQFLDNCYNTLMHNVHVGGPLLHCPKDDLCVPKHSPYAVFLAYLVSNHFFCHFGVFGFLSRSLTPIFHILIQNMQIIL